MTDDVDHMLNDLGSSAVPDPDPAFADSLELTLRTAVVASAATSALSVRRVGRWPTTVAALAFAASIVAIGLVVWQDAPPQQIFVTGATNAEVVTPTGQTIPAVVGLALREGSQVVTGDDGWATFGNEELGPNTFAVVDSSGIDEDATLALGAGPSAVSTSTFVSAADNVPAPSSSPATSESDATTAPIATTSIAEGDIDVATSTVPTTTESVTTETRVATTDRPPVVVTSEPPAGTTTTSLAVATSVPVDSPSTTVHLSTSSEPDSTSSSSTAAASTSSTTDDPLDGTGTASTIADVTTTTTSTTTSSTSSTSTTSPTTTSTSTSTSTSTTTSTTSTTEPVDRTSAT